MQEHALFSHNRADFAEKNDDLLKMVRRNGMIDGCLKSGKVIIGFALAVFSVFYTTKLFNSSLLDNTTFFVFSNNGQMSIDYIFVFYYNLMLLVWNW